MTHMDGLNPDHIDIDYDPRCGEVNRKFEPYNPIIQFFTIEKVSKNDVFWT